MCGIAGIFCVNSSRLVDPAQIDRMASAIRHRGPDDGAHYVSGPVGLGHRRLSIIDLKTGSQPMLSEDGSLAIVFNGEIYNFHSLREQLAAKGYRFRTTSDTEAILYAYDAFGEDCVRHLRGMFAFAIWNARSSELFLARDRLGIKPLYYSWDGSRLAFGSEIKAILEDGKDGRQIDLEAVDDYLTYLYVPSPKTIFRDIRKLPPATTLTVSARGLRTSSYWDVSFECGDGRSESEYIEELVERVRDSVRVHLVSDVPVGAFLSGGIDSSAVVSFIAEILGRPVITSSIGFGERAYDELPYARQMAQLLHTDAYEKIVRADAVDILDSLVWHYDEPFADSSMVPTYYVSQVARERATVALSGDGGDEAFAGYERYQFDLFENRIRGWLPASIRGPLFGALGGIYPKADWLPRPLRGKTLLTSLSLSGERGYFRTMTWMDARLRARIYRPEFQRALQGYDPFTVLEPHFARTKGWDPLSRIQYVDMKSYLPDDILTKVDRASMAHSLEVRVPLLDHEVIEFAAKIPPGLRIRGGQGKYIFKKALASRLPREILYRRKMGFTVPLAEWFRGPLRTIFEEQVLEDGAFTSHLLDPAGIRSLWTGHQRGTHNFATQLWALLVFERWGRRFAPSMSHA